MMKCHFSLFSFSLLLSLSISLSLSFTLAKKILMIIFFMLFISAKDLMEELICFNFSKLSLV